MGLASCLADLRSSLVAEGVRRISSESFPFKIAADTHITCTHTHTLYVQLCNRCIYSIVEFFSFFITLSAGSLLAGGGVGRELQDFWWLVGQGPYRGLAPTFLGAPCCVPRRLDTKPRGGRWAEMWLTISVKVAYCP